MRHALLLLLLAGCPPKTPAVVDTGPPKGSPDLKCPSGARPNGYGPPTGTSVWCDLQMPDGRVVKEGPSIEWHPNGARSVTGSWAVGERTGEWVSYYPTGTPQTRGSYVNGKKEGVWTNYGPTGEKISEGPFVGGVEHGAWVFWNTDTLTRTEGTYVLGGRDGNWYDYSPEGKPTRERVYRDGRLVTQREL